MIRAGFEALCKSGIADDYLEADKLLVVEIFEAMNLASPLQNTLAPSKQE